MPEQHMWIFPFVEKDGNELGKTDMHGSTNNHVTRDMYSQCCF